MIKKILRLSLGIVIKISCLIYKRDSSIWVLGEWFGKRCGDNCTYLANYLASEYPKIKLYWIADKDTDISLLDKNITVIIRNTVKSRYILKHAGVGVVGQSYKDLDSTGFNYLSGAKTLLLWHGIPWKYIGHDGRGEKSFFLKMYIKLFDFAFGCKYILSPSSAFDDIALSAFGIKRKNIIKAGYPRNSVFYNEKDISVRRKFVLNSIDWHDMDTYIISYMPTFRDTSSMFDIGSLEKNDMFLNYMKKKNIIIIQKGHFVTLSKRLNLLKNNIRVFNLNNIDAQSLLCASDMLITDYSGCFFDYSLLNRPIIHYLYDYETYRDKDRGLYYEKSDVMFGTEATTEEELIYAIKANIDNKSLEEGRRKRMMKKYVNYESNNSCQRIVESILNINIQYDNY